MMRATATALPVIMLALGLGIGAAGCSDSSPEVSGPVMTVYASPT